MAIVEAKVRPEREIEGAERAKDSREVLVAATLSARSLARGDPRPRPSAGRSLSVSKHLAFAFVTVDARVLAQQLVVFALRRLQRLRASCSPAFTRSGLASSARTLEGSTCVYAPFRLLRDLPVPARLGDRTPPSKPPAATYYEFRAALMVRNDEGLTKTYNRFHDPDERDPDILKLRELHAAMDRAVLDAYGWTDLQPDLRVPPRLRGRGRATTPTAGQEQEEETLALPLARRLPRRSPRPPPRPERRTRERGGPRRCRR